MVASFLNRAVSLAIAAFLFWMLVKRLGPWPAFGAWAGIMALCCTASALLLRTAALGEISWKNRVAGSFLRWGYSIGKGQLPAIALASWSMWVLMALGVVLAMRPGGAIAGMGDGTATPAGIGESAQWRYVLFAAWATNAACLLYVAGVWVKNFSGNSGGGKSLWPVMGFLLLLLVASIGLRLAGHLRTAAMVAAGPILVVGIGYAAFLVVMLTAGRNARWN